MTDYKAQLEMNRQDGYGDIDFVNPKTGIIGTTIRLNPRELKQLRDLLLKAFPLEKKDGGF